LREANHQPADTANLRSADQLPPPEHKDLPEAPYSHSWERVFEPDWRAPGYEYKREHRPQIAYINSSARVPETAMQALMEARPHEEPTTSLEESAPLRERLVDAVDSLEPRLKWIFEARYYRGMSVREIGRELSLSKSYVDRLYQQALKELARHLEDLIGER
jgi:RNA polymerase sigma factor (sigma-70 family)